MRVIYKYPLYVGDSEVRVPMDSKILKVGVQNDDAYMWVEQDTTGGQFVNLKTKVIGTGHPFDNLDDWFYVDTFMLYNGGFVGHTYARFE